MGDKSKQTVICCGVKVNLIRHNNLSVTLVIQHYTILGCSISEALNSTQRLVFMVYFCMLPNFVLGKRQLTSFSYKLCYFFVSNQYHGILHAIVIW